MHILNYSLLTGSVCFCAMYYLLYSPYVAVAISSGRNSMKTNSRIILEINRPMFKTEKTNVIRLVSMYVNN